MFRKTFCLILVAFIFFLLTYPIAADGLANSAWPKFRHDAQNTGQSSHVGAKDNALQWQYYTTGGWYISSPTIGPDGTVYFGPNGILAIHNDGSLNWDYSPGYWFFHSTISQDGTVYCGSSDGKLYAFKSDGTIKWFFQTYGVVSSAPVIGSDGTIYFGSYDNKLYAIRDEGDNARLKWTFTTNGPISASPAIAHDSTIYVWPSDEWQKEKYDNKLYALYDNGDHATFKWSREIGYSFGASPAVGPDGTIYLGAEDGNLYALNPDNSPKWSYFTNGNIFSSPAIGTDGTVYSGSTKLFAINPDGSSKWSYSTDRWIISSPAIGADGTVYFGSYDNKLYALNPNGTPKWSFQTGGGIYSSPAIGAKGTIYVGSDDGKLYAIGSPVEQPLNQTENTRPNHTVLIATLAGVVVIAGIAVVLYRKRVSGRVARGGES